MTVEGGRRGFVLALLPVLGLGMVYASLTCVDVRRVDRYVFESVQELPKPERRTALDYAAQWLESAMAYDEVWIRVERVRSSVVVEIQTARTREEAEDERRRFGRRFSRWASRLGLRLVRIELDQRALHLDSGRLRRGWF